MPRRQKPNSAVGYNKNMGSSAILRRQISSSGSVGILRYRRISVDEAKSDSNRMMSTARSGCVSSPEPPSAPWLMLPPAVDGSGKIAYSFHCLAKKQDLMHTNKIGDGSELQLPVDIDIIKDVVFVGSSHGWLALYNRRKCDLFLSNPITDRHIKLPALRALGAADRVILSSSLSTDERAEEEEGPFSLRRFASLFGVREEEDGRLAFMTFGSGSRRRLALCRPRSSNEWTLFGGDHAYDNLVYSSRHKRLFCICEDSHNKNISLEGWDIDVQYPNPPTRDWMIKCNKELDFGDPYFEWPGKKSDLKKECYQMKYLVCAESSGELFLVVRHVNLRAGPHGSLVDKVWLSRHRGCLYNRSPYKTIDFDVYKIDPERRVVKHMEDSLRGLAMFVGINEPLAISACHFDGVKPDSVYFTDENRVAEPTRWLQRANYGGHDNGIFDYRNKDFYPCCQSYPIDYPKIRRILPLPLWFTPTPTPTTKVR